MQSLESVIGLPAILNPNHREIIDFVQNVQPTPISYKKSISKWHLKKNATIHHSHQCTHHEASWLAL